MGFYINPSDMTKEEWLYQNAISEECLAEWPPLNELVPVCLVDNGSFTAAVICYKKQEFKKFNDTTHDPRPRIWFLVPKDKIVEVAPEVEEFLEI